MESPDSEALLFSTKEIFAHIPELPVLYRFLGQEDLSVVRLALMGPKEASNFREEKNKAEYLSYYVLDRWEETNTEDFSVDSSFMHGQLVQQASRPNTHESVFNRLYEILYPALGMPQSEVLITDVRRAYLNPKLLGTEDFKGADYYAVSFVPRR